MGDQPDILTERLGELRQGFLQRLDDRISIIAAASTALMRRDASDEDRLSALASLHAEAHKLVGTAGVLGFHELSGLAHKVEIICLDRMRSDLRLNETDEELVGYFRSSLHRTQHRNLMPTSPSPPSPARRSSDKGCTILLVDDDELFSQAVALEIEQHGYRAVTINDPAELGATIEKYEVNLVLMDIMFGADDLVGLFVTWELKKEGKLVCPVIMMSSRGDIDARLAAVRAGCSGYLTKPFIIRDLLTEMTILISPKSPRCS
jgi:CheY-like chemotaxis protein/HPt (histidine-containing phosphotransfer) domain-containing protein